MTQNSTPSNTEFAGHIDQIRIFSEGEKWSIDGYDWETEKYTELVWQFPTREDARIAVPFFAEALYKAGIAGTDNYGTSDGARIIDLRPGHSERITKKVVTTIV